MHYDYIFLLLKIRIYPKIKNKTWTYKICPSQHQQLDIV